jgi:hypothetical protein
MKKWLKDSVKLMKGDLVAVSDIGNRQQLALVDSVRNDANNHPRYFTLSYMCNGKKKLIDRPGSSLTFLLSGDEREDGKIITDSLSYLPEQINMKQKNKIRVTVPSQEEEIVNLV